MRRSGDFVPHGVIPAVVLPFDEDFRIDEKSYRTHLRDVAGVPGLSAVTVNGHSSEVHACTFDEQRAVLDLTMDEVGDRLPVVAGVYADGSHEAARIARMAEQGGASALLVFPPQSMTMGGQLRPEMALAHFRTIAGATDLPIIAFQYPMGSGLGYPLDTLLALAAQVPAIRAVKDWCNDPMLHERHVRTLQALPRPVNVLTTHSAWLFGSLVLGCNGLLSGAGSVIADLQLTLWQAVRADDLDHPDELRVDLDPVPGVPWSDVREVALVTREALEAVGLVGWPKTSGSRGIHINIRIERRWTYPEVRRAALALARDVERRAPSIATSKWWKEERHGVFLDYNQNAKDRTVASAYSVRPLPDARVSMPLRWDEVADVVAEDFTLATVPAIYAERGDAGAGIDKAVGSLDALLELSRRHEKEGLGDAPWPPNYAKQAGEPPRVQPSRMRRRPEDYEGRGVAGGPPPDVAAARAAAVAAGDRNAGLPTDWEGTRPTPTGRRKSSIPVIEIARAATKQEVNEGLERWKGRHPEAAAHLEPADVLTDGMRGRAYVWYRLRVNLSHVPEELRPPQEPLDPDYDPWAGYEWPDRSGQPERAPRKRGGAGG